jgi:hypothetical protein
MIPVHNYNSNFRNCLNDGTDTDQKVSLPNCKRIAGITKKKRTSTEICMDYFVLFFTSVAQTDRCALCS